MSGHLQAKRLFFMKFAATTWGLKGGKGREKKEKTNGRLVEDGASLGIQANGKEGGQDFSLALPQRLGLLRHGDGMEVDDGVDELGRGLFLVL